MKIIISVLVFCISLILSGCATSGSSISLDTREGIKQEVIIYEPESKDIYGVLVLFTGGNGLLKKGSSKSDIQGNNFLIRSKENFLKQGFIVAFVNAPSDKHDKDGMYGGFRTTSSHAEDIDKVISYLNSKYKKPLWLVGTSRGTESVAYLGINSKEKINGLILTASITVSNDKGTSIMDLPLNKITIPTLVVSNKKDKCNTTKPEESEFIVEDINNNASLKIFNGGYTQAKRACSAMTYHGFLGIEKEVIDSISSFIKAN